MLQQSMAWWRASKRSQFDFAYRRLVSGLLNDTGQSYSLACQPQLLRATQLPHEESRAFATLGAQTEDYLSDSRSSSATSSTARPACVVSPQLAPNWHVLTTRSRHLGQHTPLSQEQRRPACHCASVLPSKPTLPPTPGSVTPYAHHVLLRIPPPASHTSQTGDMWWPPILERHPALLQAFSAVAEAKARIDGVVKVTAFDSVTPGGHPEDPDCVDMMIFPAGIHWQNLPTKHIREVVTHHVVDDDTGESQPQALRLPSQVTERGFEGLALFVCTHASRDARCGTLGRALAVKLEELVRSAGQDAVKVYQVSHIGGHKFAGNVVVYGGISPCDGDWYGGLNASNAPEFLDALLHVKVGEDGGAENGVLRKWWRGRMGLTKQEQSELFDCCTGIPTGELESDTDDSSASGSSEASSDSSDSDDKASMSV